MDKSSPPPYSVNPLPGVAYSAQGEDYFNQSQTTTVVNRTSVVQEVQPKSNVMFQPQPNVMYQSQPQPNAMFQSQPAMVVQSQPAMMVQSQPAMMVQPQAIVMCMTPGAVPIRMKCTFCQQEVVTMTKSSPGATAWMICIILFLFLIWPFCLIPFFIKSCNSVKHICPLCKNVLHIFQR